MFVYSRRGHSVRISAQHVARTEHARPLIKVKQESHMIPYRRIVLWTFVSALLLVFISHGEAQTITLEQLMSSPFPSELIASKRGDKVAWVFYSQGKRNIFVAEAPGLAARQLTHHDVEDGQDVTEIVFSPNGNTLAYVRGGNKNQNGEVANPTSDVAGVKQEVWTVDVRSGRMTRIGEGNSPLFSPNSDEVEYLRDGHIWGAPVAGGKERKLFEARGAVNSPEWSPDGSELAFSSARGDHSFITIYNPRSNHLRFLSPTVDRDIAPRWSPDGKRIAFIRLRNINDTFSMDRERLQPWSIQVVDAQSGNGKEIWHSGSNDNDSFFGGFGGNDVWQWVAGDRLLFTSERDDWAHIYSISSEGGALTALTPGDFEVENVAVSPDKSFIIIATNKNDIDRRHLWKVNVAGGSPEQITRGEGIEMYPVVVNNGRAVALLHSTARDPFMPFTISVDGSNMKPLAPQALPRDFPSAQLVVPEQVIFKAADGLEIHGQLFKPKNVSGKSAAIVFMHGGPMREMLLGWHYRDYYHNSYAMNQYLASRGYMVLSVNYRSRICYGLEIRLASHSGALWASEYKDNDAGSEHMKSHADVDKKRIGLWGGSYGGYFTALGLARNSGIFAAGGWFFFVALWGPRAG